MKRIIYLLLIFLGVACILSSCYDIESTYKDYVVPNGIIYPQKADSLQANPGKYRAEIEWLRGNDPKVVSATIWWNNYADSVTVDVTAYPDTVRYIIDNLLEEDYTFYVKTYDANGNVSILQEVTTTVYGLIYESSLRPREINSIDGTYLKVEINWAAASIDSALIRTEIRYVNSSGDTIVRMIPPDETQTVLTGDLPADHTFTTVCWYSPTEKAIDIFSASKPAAYIARVSTDPIPKNLFTNAKLFGDSWEHVPNADPNMNKLENLWDGVEYQANKWEAFQGLSTAPMPQHFTINLGQKIRLSRFKLFPRDMKILWEDDIYSPLFPRVFELWGTTNPSPDGSFDNWKQLGSWEVQKPSGYGVDGAVGVVSAADRTFFCTNQVYEVEVTPAYPDANMEITYLRFRTMNTFGTYRGETSNTVLIAEISLYGTVVP
jgi:hypothetical protein